MDSISKNRLIGAAIWLFLLVLIVPQWYSHPVNFVPDGKVKTESKSTLPLVDHAYRLPHSDEEPLTDGQASKREVLKNNETDLQIAESSKKLSANEFKQQQKIIKKADAIANDDQYKGQWIVRLLAFSDINEAKKLLKKLKPNYAVYIKFYEKTQIYSVRTGPYLSKVKADKDKAKLDKMLHTNGEVVQLP